jgi:hypothetical protein
MSTAWVPLMVFYSVFASATERFSVMGQRDVGSGLEQVAIIFETDRVQLSRNSNFLDRPGPAADLGLFEGPLNVGLREDLARLRHLKSRLSSGVKRAAGLAEGEGGPHRTRWILDGKELPAGFVFTSQVEEVLSRAMALAKWKPLHGVHAELLPKGPPRIDGLGSAANDVAKAGAPHCTELQPAKYRCVIEGFGTAYLKRPAVR